MDNLSFVVDEVLPVVGGVKMEHGPKCVAVYRSGGNGGCSEDCGAGTVVPVFGS